MREVQFIGETIFFFNFEFDEPENDEAYTRNYNRVLSSKPRIYQSKY